MTNLSRDYTGRYDFSKDMTLLCKCGHVLGVHAADNESGRRPCFNEDTGMNSDKWPDIIATGEFCDCKHFRRSNK